MNAAVVWARGHDRAKPVILALEPRMMFDGAAVVDAAHAAADAAAKALIPAAAAAVQVRAADPARDGGKTEVVFIDSTLADQDKLVAGIRAGVEIQQIGGDQAGLAQIAQWAASHSGYDSIHILSSGGLGAFRLGTDVVSDASLNTAVSQAEWAEIGHALKAGGDLLVYACDAGAGSDGRALVDHLAQVSGADVAASDDRTGAAAQGGDWTLEVTSGAITTTAFAVTDWSHVLDAVTLTHGGSSTGYATIQGAVSAAQDGDTVTVSAGTFVEQVTITHGITLQGAGQSQTVIRSPLTADLVQTGGNWRNLKDQDIFAVVGIKSTTSAVTVKNLTVDGYDQGHLTGANNARIDTDFNLFDFEGIGAFDTTVTIDNVKVTRLRELASSRTDDSTHAPYAVPSGYTPTDQPSGMNHNEAIFAESKAGAGNHTLTVTNSYIDKFQKTAILAWGPTLVVDINHNTIQGYGKTLWSTGNGIQIASSDRSSMGGSNGDRRGTTGSVTDNRILDLGVVIPEPGQPGSYLNLGLAGPSGILLAESGSGFLVQGNTITGVYTPSWHDTGMSNDGGYGNQGIDIGGAINPIIRNNTISGFDIGIVEDFAGTNSHVEISGNTLSQNVLDIWTAGGDDVVSLTSNAEVVAFFESDNGIDTITNFSNGDAFRVIGYATGSVNGLVGGVPVINFTGTLTQGNGSSVAANSVQMAVSGGVTTLYVDIDGAAGAPELTIRLTGSYSLQNFQLDGDKIKYVNLAPVANGGSLGSASATVGTAFSYSLPGGAFSDADVGESLTYSATGLPAGLTINATTGAISGTPTGGRQAPFSVTITATDRAGATASRSLALDINTAPRVNGVMPQASVQVNNRLDYVVPANLVTDADGETLTYSISGLPPGLSFDPATRTVSGAPTSDGDYPVTLTVSDPRGGSTTVSTTFKVTKPPPGPAPVQPPAPPPLPPPPAPKPAPGPVISPAVAHDPAQAPVQTVVVDTSAVVVIPQATTVGGGNAFAVAVAAKAPGAPDALVVNQRIGDTVVAEGTRISVQIPTAAFADTKADARVTLVATRADGAALPNWMVFNPQTGTFEGTPPPGFKGEVVVKVVARDNEGREAVQTFKIQVGESGQGNVAPQEGQPQTPERSGDAGAPTKHAAVRPVGKPALADQLRNMSKEARLARQVALFATKTNSGRAA
jgi:hypothetical protein